jgi:hypothetical protein
MLPSVIGWIASLKRVATMRVAYDACRPPATVDHHLMMALVALHGGLNHRVGSPLMHRAGKRPSGATMPVQLAHGHPLAASGGPSYLWRVRRLTPTMGVMRSCAVRGILGFAKITLL